MFDFSEVKNYDPELAEAMEDELTRQRTNLELIASENLVSKAVMAAIVISGPMPSPGITAIFISIPVPPDCLVYLIFI